MMGVGMQEPVLIDLDAATTAVRPYAWLIDRVGDDGIKLTTAGCLPPVHIEAAFTELDLADAWIGMGNREQLTIPVLRLRESAQRMGLLRKHRGRLMVTARGKAARSDPAALSFQLAERLPLTSKDLCEEQAGLLFLIAVAAGENDADGFVADMLDAIGWRHHDRTPITTSSAAHITRRLRRGGVGFSPTQQWRSLMRTTRQLSITLPNDMAEALRERVRSGEYASESEVIREGLRALFARDQAIEAWLRDEVAAVYDAVVADPSRAVTAQRVRARLAAEQAGSV